MSFFVEGGERREAPGMARVETGRGHADGERATRAVAGWDENRWIKKFSAALFRKRAQKVDDVDFCSSRVDQSKNPDEQAGVLSLRPCPQFF